MTVDCGRGGWGRKMILCMYTCNVVSIIIIVAKFLVITLLSSRHSEISSLFNRAIRVLLNLIPR